ncbi:hypothetical protein Skr01_60670 [Sphaerisporangium krabiense]|uniref:DUF3099 domain-containing protein n=1 Tax=Sphaerisporangium krabiense TaxID=763782 RepID=A0A7W8ZBT6_9ACTN|nr:DUF3099 domain-containing protein [Sphaerisporangium krabiense]MBB5631097.1 hypothetical protein [Sphaerisporangium krabiense]GII65982.1 hypothetical protein Skr01_60670 [Sphaerisporangium krabiense]
MKVWHRRRVVHQVTDAQPSLSADIGRREKRYFVQMGIRLVCLVLAVALSVPWPVRALLVAGAIFLPYIAVIGANQPSRGVSSAFDHEAPNQTEIPLHRREIGS